MKTAKSVTDLIGHTPLLELCRLEDGLDAKIFAKLEFFNPAGSVKDRPAAAMVEEAENRGLLKSGGTIIEPTSGNTGIALASVAAAKGYKMILVMPETMSIERRKLAKAYGAEIVLTEGSKGMQGAVDKAEELQKSTPNSFIPGQFINPANPQAHENTTGPEIWEDTDGKVDIFIAGFGTGGTVSGVGKYLKSKNPNIKIIAVEPESSPLVTAGKAGPHKIQGIGANFIPKVFDKNICDEIITVSDEDAINMTREIPRKTGIFTGISSGAAVFAAVQTAKKPENKGKNIVVLLPDTGERYLSSGIFE